MIHHTVGDIGHFFVILSFVFSLIACYAYYRSTTLYKRHGGFRLKASGLHTNGGSLFSEAESWRNYARIAFLVHAISVLGVVVSLYWIISNHYYEYFYAWDHSSNDLPVHYIISSFWEGQEGSFLLWIFWHVVLGGILILTNRTWETPMMTIFCLVQAFLASMIIGTVIPGLDLKIGTSPFILMNEMGRFPVFESNPDFIPEDGAGLNPLLQNYWMVIHPPTLFLGFATTLIPFAYCIAGLWLKKYKAWIRPALPWSLVSAVALGAGILMGGYWAYETLNFEGYWNWDPVENAVYVPWLILIAAIHTMISYKSSNTALKTSIILVVVTFILILYSTFLTRSGILGESSVHSFTDLGLSGQLLIYLIAFVLLSVFLLVKRWKEIPADKKTTETYSREFWIFIGVIVFSLAAFQVIFVTSLPVYNKILQAVGIDSRMAPPANQIEFYTQWQMWFSMAIAILSGVGQYFWWKSAKEKKIGNKLAYPFIITLLISSLIIFLADISNIGYILLLTAAIFTIVANIGIILRIVKTNIRLSGGAVAHIGIGLILIGILFSAGYSTVVSVNSTGQLYSKDADEQFNTENSLLWINELTPMKGYQAIYKGRYKEIDGFPHYVSTNNLFPTEENDRMILMDDLEANGKTYFSNGDTVSVNAEDTYFRVDYYPENGKSFTLFPKAQRNPTMGLLASPDIRWNADKDLYTHVRYFMDEEEREWSDPEEMHVQLKDTFLINDYFAILEDIKPVKIPVVDSNKVDYGLRATIKVLASPASPDKYVLNPVLLYKNGQAMAAVPGVESDLGIAVNLNPDTDEEDVVFDVSTAQKDFILLKAIEKPYINLLWIGTFLLMIGLSLAVYRRYTEFKKMRDKGLEI